MSKWSAALAAQTKKNIPDGISARGRQYMFIQTIAFPNAPLNRIAVNRSFETPLGNRNQYLISFLGQMQNPQRKQGKTFPFGKKLVYRLPTAQPLGFGKRKHLSGNQFFVFNEQR